ncbi:DUF3226 domain-containing protein [Bathymodiolus thermophilus thioautotrophic gill symbiont]|uniref:Uncharacterized protein n=1 Tax=Bathymodiolus thermophilus thioautotrophic gill symbiont TaxID=2360 RepID=A0A8H8X9Y0_9GAMM|nr:DUF3226 domain-containing protein [Bathymodiolus thermophilus thioautotrophic gill symbiont]CAB5495234.1 hypothetical protein THERMOS_259 [Bathymodiolus thermophilus thioautotrophic gill symbiont]
MRIFCEGDDDEKFIISLLQHLEDTGQLNSKPEYSKYIYKKNGKSELLKANNYKAENKLIGKKIQKVLFVFDADFKEDDASQNGLEKSKVRIKQLIKGLDWGIKTDYYIFDKNLDDFIIQTLNKDHQECFKAFDKCLNIQDKNKNKKISTCLYKKLYPQAPYDFSHQNFDILKGKLIQLFQ